MASEFLDFAFDFGLTYFEPPAEKKDQLSRQEYRKGKVDFYEQSLDDTLGTGINLKFKDDDDDDEDKSKDVDISTVGDDSGDPSPMSFTEMESVFNKDRISSANMYDVNIGTYG